MVPSTTIILLLCTVNNSVVVVVKWGPSDVFSLRMVPALLFTIVYKHDYCNIILLSKEQNIPTIEEEKTLDVALFPPCSGFSTTIVQIEPISATYYVLVV